MQTDINLTGNPDDDFIRELPEIKGINMPQADPNTNYIFTIRKLGWVNIDALCFDKRTREVELITTINNKKEFGKIYLSLVVLNKNIYISGYEKNDGSYGFSHGDFETTKLPVGETAAIVITSIKDGKPYYAIQKFTIWDKQSYKLNLKETTGEKLKIALEKEI